MDKQRKFKDIANDQLERHRYESVKLPVGFNKVFESGRVLRWKVLITLVPYDDVKLEIPCVTISTHPVSEIRSKFEKSKDILCLVDNKTEDLIYGLIEKPKPKFKIMDLTHIKGKRKIDFNTPDPDAAMIRNPKYIDPSLNGNSVVSAPKKKKFKK